MDLNIKKKLSGLMSKWGIVRNDIDNFIKLLDNTNNDTENFISTFEEAVNLNHVKQYNNDNRKSVHSRLSDLFNNIINYDDALIKNTVVKFNNFITKNNIKGYLYAFFYNKDIFNNMDANNMRVKDIVSTIGKGITYELSNSIFDNDNEAAYYVNKLLNDIGRYNINYSKYEPMWFINNIILSDAVSTYFRMGSVVRLGGSKNNVLEIVPISDVINGTKGFYDRYTVSIYTIQKVKTIKDRINTATTVDDIKSILNDTFDKLIAANIFENA